MSITYIHNWYTMNTSNTNIILQIASTYGSLFLFILSLREINKII